MGGSNVDIESIFQETASTIVGQSWPRGLFRITDLCKYLDYLVTTLPFVFQGHHPTSPAPSSCQDVLLSSVHTPVKNSVKKLIYDAKKICAPYVFIVDEFEVTSGFPLTTFSRDTLDI